MVANGYVTQSTNKPTPIPSDTKTDVTQLNSSLGAIASINLGKITRIENYVFKPLVVTVLDDTQ